MIVKCSFFEEITADEDSVPIATYGLRFYECGNYRNTVKSVNAVFFKKGSANIAAKLINENDLCEVHIAAVIDDLIG